MTFSAAVSILLVIGCQSYKVATYINSMHINNNILKGYGMFG